MKTYRIVNESNAPRDRKNEVVLVNEDRINALSRYERNEKPFLCVEFASGGERVFAFGDPGVEHLWGAWHERH